MKDNEVGYGKPPKGHQWKPGQSGNPSGKKKAGKPPRPLLHDLAEQLSELVPVTMGGKKQQVPLSHVMAMGLVRDAMKAPFKERLQLLQHLDKLGVLALQSQKIDELGGDCSTEFTQAELQLLAKSQQLLEELEAEEAAWKEGGKGSEAGDSG